MSPLFGSHFMLTAIDVSYCMSICDRTGAKQWDLFQLLESRFPNTTILYLHLFGCPFLSHLSVDIAIAGNAGPVVFLRSLYSSSVIISKAGRFLVHHILHHRPHPIFAYHVDVVGDVLGAKVPLGANMTGNNICCCSEGLSCEDSSS